MRPAKPKRFRQFSLRFLLALLTLCALLIVPIAYQYRLSANQPDAIVQVTLAVGSQNPRHDAAVAAYFADLNAGAARAHLNNRLLADPRIRALPSLQQTSDPERWLAYHLRIVPSDRQMRIYVTGSGRAQHVKTAERTTLVDTALELIRTDAAEHNIPVVVTARMEVQR